VDTSIFALDGWRIGVVVVELSNVWIKGVLNGEERGGGGRC